MTEQTIDLDRLAELDRRLEEIGGEIVGTSPSDANPATSKLWAEHTELWHERRDLIDSVFPPRPAVVTKLVQAREELNEAVSQFHYLRIDRDDYWWIECTCGWETDGDPSLTATVNKGREHLGLYVPAT